MPRPPLHSHNLREQTESPNMRGVDACPAPPARDEINPSRRAVERAAGGTDAPKLLVYIAAGALLWCAGVRAFLKAHKFPLHRHSREVAAMYAVPPFVFAALLLVLDFAAGPPPKSHDA